MGRLIQIHIVAAVLLITMGACASQSRLSERQGMGPQPALPPPDTSLVPVINVVEAVGWSAGEMPVPASGLTVTAFARELDHPRWLYVLPNGDVLVAETNAPERPEDDKGIRARLVSHFQAKAGGGVPSANRITLLRDVDGDGEAEIREPFLTGLNSPFGMALVGDSLYIANTDAIVRVPYTTGAMRIDAAPTTVLQLPGGPLNHHWTKNIIASEDGTHLYVAIGSNSNAGEKGLDKEVDRAQVWEFDVRTGAHRVYATGLRNPVGMAWEPTSDVLWVAVNERDELGNDLVPDYMTGVKDGGFYGWPYSYFGSNIDQRVEPQRPDLVATATVPDYAFGAHTASLGLAYAGDNNLPAAFTHGMFIGQHGSWNRKPRSGYKVIYVPFTGAKPSGDPVDVLTGFVTDDGKAMGRPVGVAIGVRGGLLVADDVGNVVWRVTGAASQTRR
ncbi:MAG: sorbosone dehydrogenase family protein [Acidobacteria bacterium]|nr:sorbosone dehydrogenase family protein [Acidobacteriota bacterium]